MAETITIEGQSYVERNPLGVLGLSLITFGIYFFYWYYQVNDELRRFEHDDTISPVRSLMAILIGWIVIVPPFIAFYNTGRHIQSIERRRSIQPQLEPALVIVIMFVLTVGNGIYLQEHLNRVWENASYTPALPGEAGRTAAIPPPPEPPAGDRS